MSLLTKIKQRIFGDPNKKILQHYNPRVEAINALQDEMSALSDAELKAKTGLFKERLKKKEGLDDILVEAFAVVRETSGRVLNMRHFDVQLIGGMVLHEGLIAEMRTGEGKTLMSTLAAYLNALEQKGVYIVTVNDYLAKRDSEWMGQIYSFLGVSVGVIQSGISQQERIEAYGADITYGTNNEFGFDYLRDNLAHSLKECCQVRRHFAIIDEVDSILIDEARTPLIISGPIQDSPDKFKKAAKIVRVLEIDKDFTVDEKHKNVVLTDDGIVKIEKSLGLDNIYSVKHMDAAHMVVQCLKAMHIFKRDVDYVLKDGEIVIVDEFTGRLMDGRRFSDGLHQAIEAIEKVKIREESQTLASVTFQNYFRMFPKLSGMTGTALTEADEFENIYSLAVVPIPTNVVVTREDLSDVVYNTKAEKYKAIVEQIAELNKKGQPVLVGTIAIETSELVSKLLKSKKIKHNVLNAKQHKKEAEVISSAGKKGSVTIATNMAGRGTDIVLGEGVKELGGLCVLGTGRHESRRIDNQLRGRAGRQGDPGLTKFYVALEDDLMRMFGSDRISKIMSALKMPEDTPIESPLISKSIEKAQTKVEKYHFSMRKQILEYDDVMSQQRETIYGIRRRILERKDIGRLVKEGVSDLVKGLFIEHAGQELKNKESIEGLSKSLRAVYGEGNFDPILNSDKKNEEKIKAVEGCFFSGYESKKAAYPPGLFDAVVSAQVLLVNVDRKWMDHLNNMDILREGIGLRAWGQRHPLIEYKREAYDMFTELRLNIYEESLSMIYRAELSETPTKVVA